MLELWWLLLRLLLLQLLELQLKIPFVATRNLLHVETLNDRAGLALPS